MGMCLGLQALSDETIGRVLADPPLIWLVVSPDDTELYEQTRKEQRGGLLSKLFGKAGGPTPPTRLELRDEEMASADLDKSWHGIHYLLTQSAAEGNSPLDFLVVGGTDVGDIEVGYCPVRAFSSDEVKAIHSSLQAVDEALLKSSFNPARMMELEIYPSIWDRDPASDDPLGYCIENFFTLKQFIAELARNEMGLIVTLQ